MILQLSPEDKRELVAQLRDELEPEIKRETRWISAKVAFELYGIPPRTLRFLANEKKLVSKSDGLGKHLTRYSQDDIEELLAKGAIKSTTWIARENAQAKVAKFPTPQTQARAS